MFIYLQICKDLRQLKNIVIRHNNTYKQFQWINRTGNPVFERNVWKKLNLHLAFTSPWKVFIKNPLSNDLLQEIKTVIKLFVFIFKTVMNCIEFN